VAGTLNFASDGRLATYLAWLIPWGTPVTLLAETPGLLTDAQRELARVGIDRPAAAAVGAPEDWIAAGDRLVSFPCADFAALAAARRRGERMVVLDVRRDSERAHGAIDASAHIPLHQLRDRLDELPDGTVWVHCASGMRAAIAASLLDAAGRDVVTVDDDFSAAARAGLTQGPA
jgi:rhodanese-related sulfurtransferase